MSTHRFQRWWTAPLDLDGWRPAPRWAMAAYVALMLPLLALLTWALVAMGWRDHTVGVAMLPFVIAFHVLFVPWLQRHWPDESGSPDVIQE